MEVSHVSSKSTYAESLYPADVWPAVDCSTLTSASEECLSSLEPNTHHTNTWFKPSSLSKVEVTGSHVSRLLLFGDEQPDCSLWALHPPAQPTQVVAVYLLGKWCLVDDVLKTSRKSRTGLLEVQSAMERVILFLLSQVVERRPGEETLFTPHPRTEHAKLLWCDGEAVGFYTVKRKGSLCGGCTGLSYRLPVLDTVMVRRRARRRGLGLQMLDDFCASFPREEELGVSHPLSPGMAGVCRKYLVQHAAQRERLYEAEAPGDQRRNIWLGLQLGRYAHGEEVSRGQGSQHLAGPAAHGLEEQRDTMTEDDDRSHKLPCDSRPESPRHVHTPRPDSDPGIESHDTSRAGRPLRGQTSSARPDPVPDPGPPPGTPDSVSSRTGPRQASDQPDEDSR